MVRMAEHHMWEEVSQRNYALEVAALQNNQRLKIEFQNLTPLIGKASTMRPKPLPSSFNKKLLTRPLHRPKLNHSFRLKDSSMKGT